MQQKLSTMSINLMEDSAFASFIEETNSRRKARAHLPLEEQRQYANAYIVSQNTCHDSVKHIENVAIQGNDKNTISIRWYIPETFGEKLPVITYFHGGGWMFGSVEASDAVCRRLAHHTNCIIASVEYRLAPEYPFPKPLEDCYIATKYVFENAHVYEGDKNSITVAGESAGGNLAVAVSLMAQDKKEFSLAAQLLIYPCISSSIQDEAYDHCPDRYYLTKDIMKFCWDNYAPTEEDKQHQYVSFDHRKSLTGLPPTIIITAEYDPLRPEAEQFAYHLEKAGVSVIRKNVLQVIHGFLYIPLYNEAQKVQWTKEIGESLRQIGIKAKDLHTR